MASLRGFWNQDEEEGGDDDDDDDEDEEERRMLEPPKTAGQCQDIGIRRCILIDNGSHW